MGAEKGARTGKRISAISLRDAISSWSPSDLPDWLDEECYATRIQPVIEKLSKTAMAEMLGVLRDYAYQFGAGNGFRVGGTG